MWQPVILLVMQEVLRQSQKAKYSLVLDCIVVVFDQTLSAKAMEIIWKQKDSLFDMVPQMGVLHTVSLCLK